MKVPNAIEPGPTSISSTTVLSEVRITDTMLSIALMT